MTDQCSGQVRGDWGRHSSCYSNGKYEYNGKFYCGMHHPLRIAERDKKRNREYEEKREADRLRRLEYAYKQVAEDLGVSINKIKSLGL